MMVVFDLINFGRARCGEEVKIAIELNLLSRHWTTAQAAVVLDGG
jgi:hypothetical protein